MASWDPVSSAVLEEALARVPELVAAARERWAQSSRMLAYQRPPEPPRPAAPAPGASNAREARQQPGVAQRRLM
ncbi:MAG: hypothetical protein Q8O76_07870 [Chloroflexota bacterium]|nr:hypothetical protein [Chloroflexota bacterium]